MGVLEEHMELGKLMPPGMHINYESTTCWNDTSGDGLPTFAEFPP